MPWTNTIPFPFIVVDPNTGNPIFIIDSTGMHIVGSTGRIDGQVDGAGQPTFFFRNPTSTTEAFINSPISAGFVGLGMNSDDYNSPNLPGNPNLRTRLFLTNNLIDLGPIIISSQIGVAARIVLRDNYGVFYYADQNAVTQAQIKIDSSGIQFQKDGSETVYQKFDPSSPAKGFFVPVVSGTEEDWHSINPLNGWGVVIQPQYRIDPTGRVWMRGIMSSGALGAGTQIFQLPSSTYYPGVEANMHVAADGAADNIIKVQTNGAIAIFNANAGNYYIDGLSWSTI